MGASLLAAIGLLWFFYSQVKLGQSPPGNDLQTLKSTPGTVANSPIQGPADSSAPKSNYTYTRLGLWAPSNPGSTPSHENSSYIAQSITTPAPSASPTPAPDSDLEQKVADDQLSSPPVASPSGVPSAESTLQAESGGILKGSPEEQSLKQLVLEYLGTMATNDSSALERLLAGRVNFYGKGVLSFPEIEESMERYRRQWPIRKWESKGEPEFPNTLHSSDPNQYEVLQPFDWTVANGTKQKKGSAILYLRIRKAENGAFHIFHLEQRHL